jgi:hypothetical protein
MITEEQAMELREQFKKLFKSAYPEPSVRLIGVNIQDEDTAIIVADFIDEGSRFYFVSRLSEGTTSCSYDSFEEAKRYIR